MVLLFKKMVYFRNFRKQHLPFIELNYGALVIGQNLQKWNTRLKQVILGKDPDLVVEKKSKKLQLLTNERHRVAHLNLIHPNIFSNKFLQVHLYPVRQLCYLLYQKNVSNKM